ncbi:MAG: hypothetical protein NVS3B14_07330 [Ktedonobacteraceae bacterium]
MKIKVLRFGFFAAVLVMLTLGAFAMHFAGAHAAAPSATATTTVTPTPTVVAKAPHVSILRHKGGTVFGKTSLTVTHKVAFNFDNRTIIAQSVMLNGKKVLTINPKSSAPYTLRTAGTYTFTLASNTTSTLTVTAQ